MRLKGLRKSNVSLGFIPSGQKKWVQDAYLFVAACHWRLTLRGFAVHLDGVGCSEYEYQRVQSCIPKSKVWRSWMSKCRDVEMALSSGDI